MLRSCEGASCGEDWGGKLGGAGDYIGFTPPIIVLQDQGVVSPCVIRVPIAYCIETTPSMQWRFKWHKEQRTRSSLTMKILRTTHKVIVIVNAP